MAEQPLCESPAGLIPLEDSVSRGNGSNDDAPEEWLWRKVQILNRFPDGRPVPPGSPDDWIVSAMLGSWYSRHEHEALDAEHAKGYGSALESRVIPWGAVLPIRLEDPDKFFSEKVGKWLQYAPLNFNHPYTAILFYELLIPSETEQAEYVLEGGRPGNLRYVANVYFLVELHDILGAKDDRLPDDVFRSLVKRETRRVITAIPKSVPIDAWHVMHPGEVLWPGMCSDGFGKLDELENSEGHQTRFMDAYVLSLCSIMGLDKVRTPLPPHVRARVSSDYWVVRRMLSPNVFAALDSRIRFLVILCIVRLSALGQNTLSNQIENALIRFVRSEYELGWPTEHTMLDFMNWREHDKGRVPTEYCTAALENGKLQETVTQLPRSVQATAKKILTVQPKTREEILRSFEKVVRTNAFPGFGGGLVDGAPTELRALSDRFASKGLSGTWVKKADVTGEYCCRQHPNTILDPGDSFAIARGYPTRFYYVRDSNIEDSAYHTKAVALHEALRPRPGSPKPPAPSILVLRGGLELVVYPSIVFESLEVLCQALGTKLTQPNYHTLTGLWLSLPPVDKALSYKDIRLVSPQPDVDCVCFGMHATLLAQIVVNEGDKHKTQRINYAYEADSLINAVRQLRLLYQRGHPSEAIGVGGAQQPSIAEPSVYWLRPLKDFCTSSLDSLPPDARNHIDALPHIDMYDDQPNAFAEAVVYGYRDVPTILSESLRSCIRREHTKVASVGSTRRDAFIAYLKTEWGSDEPEVLDALVDRIIQGLSGKASATDLMCNMEELAQQVSCAKAPNGTEDNAASEDADFATFLAEHAPAQQPSPPHRQQDVEMTERDVAIKQHADELNTEKNAFEHFRQALRPLWAWFDLFLTADRQRLCDCLWARPEADRNTVRFTDIPAKDGKDATFMWVRGKSKFGGIGPASLAIYAYSEMVGELSEDELRRIRDEGKKNKTGMIGYFFETSNAVVKRKERLPDGTLPPTPPEDFPAWCTRVLDKLVRDVKAERQALTLASSGLIAPLPSNIAFRTNQPQPNPSNNNNAKSAAEADSVWVTSLRLTGAARTYLRETRGLWMLSEDVLERSPFLRYVSQLPYAFKDASGTVKENQRHPALVCFCVGATGMTSAAQRIYLQPNGTKMAVPEKYRNKNNPIKKTLASLNADNYFFLAQPGRIEHFPFVFISEGPEKALAVAACSRFITSFATLGLGNTTRFAMFKDMVPQPALVMVGDADHTVNEQREKAEALKRDGWNTVLFWIPRCSEWSSCRCKDANDVADKHGISELRSQLCIPIHLWTTFIGEGSPCYEKPDREWRRYPFLERYNL